MNYHTLFLINALITALLGLGCLVTPSIVLGQFGVDGYAATKLVSQFLGTALLALGLLLWFAKDVSDANLQRGMGVALLTGAAAGLALTLAGAVSGVLRTNWWFVALIYLVSGLAYGYLVFRKPNRLNQS